MSMWPSGFEDPIDHKDNIRSAKETGDYKRKTLVQVKAASKYANCSLFLEQDTIKFMNNLLKEGKGFVAVEELKLTFQLIKEIQLKKYYKSSSENRDNIITDPAEILRKALDNARPLMAIQKVKVGSVVYSVPSPITYERSMFEARRWILSAARDREKGQARLHSVLANILVETAHGTGRIIAMRNEHHKTCEQNRAHAHYRLTA